MGEECYGDKFPMAWGVPQQTTRHQKSIFPQYTREIKHLTLRDIESYLVPDGWSRSPLSFPASAWIDRLLPQQQVNNTSIIYIMVLDLF